MAGRLGNPGYRRIYVRETLLIEGFGGQKLMDRDGVQRILHIFFLLVVDGIDDFARRRQKLHEARAHLVDYDITISKL